MRLPNGELVEIVVTADVVTAAEIAAEPSVRSIRFGLVVKIEGDRPEWSLPDQWWRGDNS
jgi:hypothetical protein